MSVPFLARFQTSFLKSFLPHQSVQGHSQLKLAAYSALERTDSQIPWPARNPGSWLQGIQLCLPLEVRELVQPARPLYLKSELWNCASKAGGRNISLEPLIPTTIL